LTTGLPSLWVDDVAIKLVLEVPNALFEKPRLEAKVTIPKEAVVTEIINAETVDNVEELVKSKIGLDLKVNVVKPEEEQGAD
jgi:hypothetical protein